MPFYEYQCNHCGHTLEAMQKISEAPWKKCPHCGKPQLQRLMSAPVFRLKGGGWYETDFKSEQDNKRNLAERPEAEAPKEDKKEDKKEDQKETTEAASKDAAAPGAAKPVEKAAEKPAEKATAGTQKPTGAGGSRRASPSAAKSKAKAPAKRPSRPAVKRSAAKPARRR